MIENSTDPVKRDRFFKREMSIFQPSIFRGYASFEGGTYENSRFTAYDFRPKFGSISIMLKHLRSLAESYGSFPII